MGTNHLLSYEMETKGLLDTNMLKDLSNSDESSKFQIGDLVEINSKHPLPITQPHGQVPRTCLMSPGEVGVVLDSIFLEEDGDTFHVFVCLWNQKEIVCCAKYLRKKEQ